jgi:hypothetical protein
MLNAGWDTVIDNLLSPLSQTSAGKAMEAA